MDITQIAKQIELQKRPNIAYALKQKTEIFTKTLFHTLFDSATPVSENLIQLEKDFLEVVTLACCKAAENCKQTWENFLQTLPRILEKLNKDAAAFLANDPAVNGIEEVYLAYPGFHAIVIHRICHQLLQYNIPLVPRLMSEYAHRITGVDINPGATIGESFYIDHGTGIVIGETAIIKDNVRIYQGVTLGGLYVSKDLKNTKRHPTVEDNVTIYASATILGGDTIIGKNSIIGGNVWVTKSIPENSIVYHTPDIKIKKAKTRI